MLPGERLQRGIQDVFILGEDEGLILKATEAFTDSIEVSSYSSAACLCWPVARSQACKASWTLVLRCSMQTI